MWCCAPPSASHQEGWRASRPSTDDVDYVHLVRPFSARFLLCKITTLLFLMGKYLVGEILRLCQHLVLSQTSSHWWFPWESTTSTMLPDGDSLSIISRQSFVSSSIYSLIYLMLKLSHIWPVETSASQPLCLLTCSILEHSLASWHLTFQVHIAFALSQALEPANSPDTFQRRLFRNKNLGARIIHCYEDVTVLARKYYVCSRTPTHTTTFISTVYTC